MADTRGFNLADGSVSKYDYRYLSHLPNANFATVFSSADFYPEGSYVWYNNNLYRFIKDHNPGPFNYSGPDDINNGDVVLVSLGDQLEGLYKHSALSDVDMWFSGDDINWKTTNTYIDGKYVNNGGLLVDSPVYSEPAELSGKKMYSVSARVLIPPFTSALIKSTFFNITIGDTTYSPRIAIYRPTADSDGTTTLRHIESISNPTGKQKFFAVIQPKPYVRYARVSCRTKEKALSFFKLHREDGKMAISEYGSTVTSPAELLKPSDSKVPIIPNKMALSVNPNVNGVEPVGSDGEDLGLPTLNGALLTFNGNVKDNPDLDGTGALFIDKYGDAYSSIKWDNNDYTPVFKPFKRLSNIRDTYSGLMLFDRIAVVGDQLCTGITKIGSNYEKNFAYSWPKFLGRITGADMFNYSYEYLTTRGVLVMNEGSVEVSDHDNWVKAQRRANEYTPGAPYCPRKNQIISDLNDNDRKCDLFILAFGPYDAVKYPISYIGDPSNIDDATVTESPIDSFYGNYSRLIKCIKNATTAAKIVLLSMHMPESFVSLETQAAYNDAIKTIAVRTGVAFIDIATDEFFNSPEWNNRAFYTGIYPTPIFYVGYAKAIDRLVSRAITGARVNSLGQDYYESYFYDFVGPDYTEVLPDDDDGGGSASAPISSGGLITP